MREGDNDYQQQTKKPKVYQTFGFFIPIKKWKA